MQGIGTPVSQRFARLKRKGAVVLLIVFGSGVAFSPAVHSQDSARGHSFAPVQDALEKQTLELINRDRVAPEYAAETKGRARPLQWDDRLAAAARAHSQEMSRNGSFSHTGASGTSPAQRISAAGVPWISIGENIAACQTVVQAEEAFMDEPRFERNHRWNILNADYTRVGVGIVRAPDGTIYITEDFAQTR